MRNFILRLIKKTGVVFLGIMMSLVFVTGALASCGLLVDREKVAYTEAMEYISEAESAEHRSGAMESYRKAVETLSEIVDYQDAQEQMDKAKLAHDKLLVEEIRLDYEFDYFEVEDDLKDLYDRSAAESISLWMDFSQQITLRYYNTIVTFIKGNLKDPNSFTDVGSSYRYTVTESKEEGTLIVKDLTYVVDYTATNSFGGVVRNQFEHTFEEDISYKHEYTALTGQQAAAACMHLTFDDLCDSLYQ